MDTQLDVQGERSLLRCVVQDLDSSAVELRSSSRRCAAESLLPELMDSKSLLNQGENEPFSMDLVFIDAY